MWRSGTVQKLYCLKSSLCFCLILVCGAQPARLALSLVFTQGPFQISRIPCQALLHIELTLVHQQTNPKVQSDAGAQLPPPLPFLLPPSQSPVQDQPDPAGLCRLRHLLEFHYMASHTAVTCNQTACFVQVDLTLLQQGGSPDEPPADENRFELVLKKLKGIAVSSFGILQIPISFKAVSLEESGGEVHICMDTAAVSSLSVSEPLLWRYPIKVRACLQNCCSAPVSGKAGGQAELSQ